VSPRLRLVLWRALGVGLVATCFALVHLQQVHQRSYEWGWSPPAAAEKIQYQGRSYLRSRAQVLPVPADGVPLGRTEGGGRIYGPPPGRLTPTVLYVVVEGATFQYGLMGGP
jgi:hypothetical protein